MKTAKNILTILVCVVTNFAFCPKRLQIDRRFSKGERRLVFKKLVYADGTESGSTDYDLIFKRKVERNN